MDRVDWYFRQKVTEAEMDAAFDKVETAIRNTVLDANYFGAYAGVVVTEKSGTPNLTVDVASGLASDQLGQRISVPSTQNVNVALDFNNVSTGVAAPGNEKWVSVFLQFDRVLSDPRVDGNSLTVNFLRTETFKFKVMQGAEALIGAATRPTLQSDAVLLADINRTNGQTQILNANISGSSGSGLFSTTRRQDNFVIAGTPLAMRAGRVGGALSTILAAYNAHVNGTADEHLAVDVAYAGGAAWADTTTNPAATVEAQLDKIVSELAATAGGVQAGGVNKIGGPAITGVNAIAAGRLGLQLQSLKVASFHDYLGGGTWADGTTNPATDVETQLDKIISDLSATASSGGAARVGIGARTTWLGGRTNASGTLFAAVDKIITDLSAATAGDDGAERIGAESRAGSPTSLSSSSVATQLTELLTAVNARARHNAAETITGGFTLSGATAGTKLRTLTGTDGNAEIDESQDVWVAPTLTGDAVWSIDTTTPAPNGAVIMVRKPNEDFDLDIAVEGGGTLFTWPTGEIGGAIFVKHSGTWIVLLGVSEPL